MLSHQPNNEGDIGFVIPIQGNLATEKVLAERKPVFIKDAQHNPLTTSIHALMVNLLCLP